MAVAAFVHRYEVGLEKLLTAEKEVNIMKQELIELQPKLIETGEWRNMHPASGLFEQLGNVLHYG
jgi:hypothetical protein